MITAANITRLLRIQWILLRYGLDEIIFKLPILIHLRFLRYFSPWFWLGKHKEPIAIRIRCGLEDLGPVFVKFGQTLSTRPDLLPVDIADELAKLQDKVPSFPGAQAREIVEKSLQSQIDTIFSSFQNEPLASASIAQVHAAVLKDGSDVVVKVLRPKMAERIRQDIDLMHLLARTLCYWLPESRRLNPVQVIEEYEKTIFNELDLLREAANASQLRRNFEHSPLLYVPKVHWAHCHKDVMLIERIYGVAVNDMVALRQAGVNLQKLSENGVEIFFTQVFKHNFFHADMHPGNIFVSIEDPENPKYLGVDFGIVGTLSVSDQRYLAENFLAFFRHDYKRVAELHIESSWVPPDTRTDELESAIRTVCEPIFQRPLHEISFGHLLLRLFRIARQFNMEVQPQLILLQKTLLNIEGLGRQLYPKLDLWKTAKPFFEQWMKDRSAPKTVLTNMLHTLPRTIEQLPKLPQQVAENLIQIQLLQEQMANNQRDLQTLMKRGQRHVLLLILVLVAATAVVVWY